MEGRSILEIEEVLYPFYWRGWIHDKVTEESEADAFVMHITPIFYEVVDPWNQCTGLIIANIN